MSNPIVHFDVSGPEEGPLHRFYGDLLGWEIDVMRKALVTDPAGNKVALIER